MAFWRENFPSCRHVNISTARGAPCHVSRTIQHNSTIYYILQQQACCIQPTHKAPPPKMKSKTTNLLLLFPLVAVEITRSGGNSSYSHNMGVSKWTLTKQEGFLDKLQSLKTSFCKILLAVLKRISSFKLKSAELQRLTPYFGDLEDSECLLQRLEAIIVACVAQVPED